MEKSFILRAVELARKGTGHVTPNPHVGALIVKGRKIIGEGYHKSYGDLHAEIEAIRSCNDDVRGATLYCNLEPCSTHYPGKKNPPCCDAIISSGISKVVIGQLDPNPHVSGSGVKRLTDAGIEVVLIEDSFESYYVNRVFNSSFISDLPWVHLKWAQSLDGSIALDSGVSKWISSESCREHAHNLRHEYDAIIVGKNTLQTDNPELTVRYDYSSNIRPVIIDRYLELDRELKVFSNNPLVLCSSSVPKEKIENYPYECISLAGDYFDIAELLKALKSHGIHSLLVEGGAGLLTQFYNSGLWSEITTYIAPKIMGSGINPIGKLNVNHPSETERFCHINISQLGDHIVFNALKEELCSPV